MSKLILITSETGNRFGNGNVLADFENSIWPHTKDCAVWFSRTAIFVQNPQNYWNYIAIEDKNIRNSFKQKLKPDSQKNIWPPFRVYFYTIYGIKIYHHFEIYIFYTTILKYTFFIPPFFILNFMLVQKKSY